MWVSLGHGSYLGCQWLMVFAFAKLGGPDVVGAYAFGLAVSAPIIMLANMHLRELHASDAGGEYLLQERMALRVTALAVGLGCIALLCWSLSWGIALSAVVMAVACAKTIESVAELGYGALQVQQRFRGLARAQIIRGLFGLTCGVVGFLLSHDVLIAILGLIAGWLSTFVLHDIPTLLRAIPHHDGLLPRCRSERFWSLMRQAGPMGIAGGLNTLTLMSANYAIHLYHDSAALGFYVTVGYLLLPINILILALGQAAVPRLASAFHRGDAPTILRLVLKVSAVALTVGLIAIVISLFLGSRLLSAVYGPDWGHLGTVLVVLAIASLLQWLATVCGFAVTAMRQLVHQLSIAIVTCVVSVVSSFALVPTYGLLGAGWSLILTSLTLLMGYLWLFGRSYRQLRTVSP